MSTAGTIAHAISSLRQNRAMLKKRKLKDIKELLYELSGKTELEFKQVSAEEMAIIKADIRKKAKKAYELEIITYFICTFIVLSFFYWLIYF
jgi:hypothetical protein